MEIIRIHSLTNGAEDESARLADAVALLTDGDRLEVTGDWLLGNMVELNGLSGVSIVGMGATVKLEAKTWTDFAALVLRDCAYMKLSGISFDCSGQAFVDGEFASVPAVAVISTAEGGDVWEVLSHDIEIDADFTDCATRGLAMRLVDHVRVAGTYFLKQDNCHFIEFARCNDVTLLPGISFDSNEPEEWDAYGSMVAVSPGNSAVSGPEAEFDTQPAINGLCLTHVNVPFEETAPTGLSSWTFSFDDASSTAPPGYDFAQNSWFFLCYDTNGSDRILNEQFQVVSVDNMAKEITVEALDYSGTAITFQGQKFRISSLNTDRMVKGFKASCGTINNASGAGIFALGVDGGEISEFLVTNTLDYRLGGEWCMNLAIHDNRVYSELAEAFSHDIAFLYFTRNCSSYDNYMGKRGFNAGGLRHHANCQVSANITSARDYIENGTLTVVGADGPVFLDCLTVTDLTQREGVAGIVAYGATADDANCIQNIRISGCSFANDGQQPIAMASVQNVVIENCRSDGARYRGLLAIDGEGDLSNGFLVRWNSVARFGAEWSALPVVGFIGSGTPPEVRFEGNRIDDSARSLYALGNGTPLPALRPGEAIENWNGGGSSIAAGGSVTSSNITVIGARPGDPVVAWPYSAFAGMVVEGAVTATDTVRITITNVSGSGITPSARDYGVYVPLR